MLFFHHNNYNTRKLAFALRSAGYKCRIGDAGLTVIFSEQIPAQVTAVKAVAETCKREASLSETI